MPSFHKLTESILEDEDGMRAFSQIYGKFVYSLSQQYPIILEENSSAIC